MVEGKGIVKRYGELCVADHIDLDVGDGEIVAVVGPSGAGKTTLLQILGTLDRPDEGRVVYDGVDVMGLNDTSLARFRNRNIGFIFQFHQLLPEFSLVENIEMPALIGGMSRGEARRRAEELAEYLGLQDRLTHKPAALSGGERQRAAVARALVNRPRIVFADEPTGSLDSRNREELHRLFFDLRRDMNHSFLIVTHDETLAQDADRIVHMSDGRIERIERREARQ